MFISIYIFGPINIIPCDIDQFYDVKCIQIESCKIKNLPKEIFNLVNLVELYINYTNIKILSHEIGNLRSLEILNVSHNQLFELPKEVFELINLRHIGLNGNQFIETNADINFKERLEILRKEGYIN